MYIVSVYNQDVVQNAFIEFSSKKTAAGRVWIFLSSSISVWTVGLLDIGTVETSTHRLNGQFQMITHFSLFLLSQSLSLTFFVAADDTQTDCAKTVVNGNIDDNVFAKKSFICHDDHKKKINRLLTA